MQPPVRPLPVVVGAARPSRADHRRGQARDRRAPRPPGLLRQHRRRRTDDPARLLRARRARDRQRDRRQVLDQRRVHRRRRRPPADGDGVPRHPDQPRRHRCGHERCGARRRFVRHRPAGDGPPPRRRVRSVQDLRRRHPPQRRSARRVQGARRLLRRAAAGHASAPVGPWRRIVARAAPDQRPATPDLRVAAGPRRRRADR